MDSALWGFLGTLVGAAVTFLATYWQLKNAAKMQEEGFEREREERRRLLQLETLAHIQRELEHHMQHQDRVLARRVAVLKETGKWEVLPTDDPLTHAAWRADLEVTASAEKVRDDETRRAIVAFNDDVRSVGRCKELDGVDRWNDLREEYAQLQERLGPELRKHI